MLSVIILSAIIVNVIMDSAFMLSVIMISAIMLSVVLPLLVTVFHWPNTEDICNRVYIFSYKLEYLFLASMYSSGASNGAAILEYVHPQTPDSRVVASSVRKSLTNKLKNISKVMKF